MPAGLVSSTLCQNNINTLFIYLTLLQPQGEPKHFEMLPCTRRTKSGSALWALSHLVPKLHNSGGTRDPAPKGAPPTPPLEAGGEAAKASLVVPSF